MPNACKFMADPTLDGMSVAQKAAYLASMGVDAFVIAQATWLRLGLGCRVAEASPMPCHAQATCVAPEDNVQVEDGEP